jgi:hypothetical protein
MPTDLFADFFEDPESWRVYSSGLSKGSLHADKGPDGSVALRLDFDFHGGGGFIVARKLVGFRLPDTFEFSFFLRGDCPSNHLEFKIADPGGADVWRNLRENHDFPHDWTQYHIAERDLPFAWGPEGGGPPDSVGAIELVIVAGQGGSGSVWFAELTLEDQTVYLPEKVSASSFQPNYPPGAVFEHGLPSGWRARKKDPSPRWEVDFGRVSRFGGLIIHWPLPLPPREFDIEISRDGKTWEQIYQAKRAMGPYSHVPTPGAEARAIRMNFANAEIAAICDLRLRPDSFSHSVNDFIHAVADDFPRGNFPRYWHHEQSYWTPIGSPLGRRRALINEEGLVETGEAGFSLEPFLIQGGVLVTWDDVVTAVSLPDDGAPFPEASWTADGLSLRVMPWVDGDVDSLVLHVTYQVVNTSGRELRLAVAARPYQVNPPWQAFRNLGGHSPVHEVRCEQSGMTVEGRRVTPDRRPDDSGCACFEEDGVLESLSRGTLPPHNSVTDRDGFASGAMLWILPEGDLPFEVTLSVPYFETAEPLQSDARESALAAWRKVLSSVKWEVPASASQAVACFRTGTAHILINRDGPAIQPGPRRYTRSWVRDCVIMGEALAKAELPEALREFVAWYAPFQRGDGFVPCVVDRDGVDWLVEHDSHGQFLWGIHEAYPNCSNRDALIPLWENVRKAAEYIIKLRESRKHPNYQKGELSACYGLLPESASHEGYLAHHVHSYWDDFWGIRGLQAAAKIADCLDHHENGIRWKIESERFRHDVLRSLDKVIAERKINYIPGSVEWADFDPTATANAIAQLDFGDCLPPDPMRKTFETYLEGFRKKHRGETPWVNYTAYEIRIIGAFVRMGKRDEAHELLEFFLSDRRPLHWNQWPEISWRDPLSPGHLGDVPHTWIAAEYMIALASMVASEREATRSMVLAAGLSWKWISEENGFAVNGLMTNWGDLHFHIHAPDESHIRFTLGEGITIPAGGLKVAPPLPAGRQIATATDSDGQELEISSSGETVTLRKIPIAVTLELSTVLT